MIGKKFNVQRVDYFFALADRIYFCDTGRIILAKKLHIDSVEKLFGNNLEEIG